MGKEQFTFAGLPSQEDLDTLSADAAILGIPFGVPYSAGELSPSHTAPEAIRRQSLRYPEDVYSWDFDLGGTLLGEAGLRAWSTAVIWMAMPTTRRATRRAASRR